MGLDMSYRSGDRSFARRLPMTDWDLVSALSQHLPAEMSALFEVADFGEPAPVTRSELEAAIPKVQALPSGQPDLLPQRYEYELERFPIPGVSGRGFRSGGMGGIRLPDDPDHACLLTTGFNECSLQRMALGPDGQGRLIEKRDLRTKTELVTENFGTIRFRRSGGESAIDAFLDDLQQFLAGCDDEVTKILA